MFTTLNHKPIDHPMKRRPFERQFDPGELALAHFSRAQTSEIIHRFGRHRLEQLDDDSSDRFAGNGQVEKDDGVGIFGRTWVFLQHLLIVPGGGDGEVIGRFGQLGRGASLMRHPENKREIRRVILKQFL